MPLQRKTLEKKLAKGEIALYKLTQNYRHFSHFYKYLFKAKCCRFVEYGKGINERTNTE